MRPRVPDGLPLWYLFEVFYIFKRLFTLLSKMILLAGPPAKSCRAGGFLFFAMPFYYLVAVAVSKWFSQLKLLGIVSLLNETILKRP